MEKKYRHLVATYLAHETLSGVTHYHL
jgi:hypothetical protein